MDSLSFPLSQEPFVDAERAWRFRLSELSRWLEQETVELDSHRGRNERRFLLNRPRYQHGFFSRHQTQERDRKSGFTDGGRLTPTVNPRCVLL
jgi:hypothetical protein